MICKRKIPPKLFTRFFILDHFTCKIFCSFDILSNQVKMCEKRKLSVSPVRVKDEPEVVSRSQRMDTTFKGTLRKFVKVLAVHL
jgi:hypothetical protein